MLKVPGAFVHVDVLSEPSIGKGIKAPGAFVQVDVLSDSPLWEREEHIGQAVIASLLEQRAGVTAARDVYGDGVGVVV